jgi:diguanylate cyclase (GGDEF)-like protein
MATRTSRTRLSEPGPQPQAATSVDAACRRELGLALAARVDDCVAITEARLRHIRWPGTPNAGYLARRPGIIWFSTLLQARWLASGVEPHPDELGWITQDGRLAAEENVPAANIVRGNLAWRDALIRVLTEEAERSASPARVLRHATRSVVSNCDAGIVRTLEAFDDHLAAMAAELAHERLALRHQALHDPLTGVANRTLLMERLSESLDRSGAGACAVLLLDIDDFKDINDDLGHDAGDAVLVRMAKRVRAAVRPQDVVARLGGDELCVVLEDADSGEAIGVASRIARALDRPFALRGRRTVSVSASVGVAIAAADDTAESMLRKADVAMYGAKADGKGCVRLYQGAPDDAPRGGSDPAARHTAPNRSPVV